MNQSTSFGGFVRQRRREMDLTQEELARRVGCAAITLRKIEADDIRASVQIAERLAMALAIPLEERAGFVRWARSVRPASSELLPVTPPPSMEEIGREDLTGRAIRGYALAERIGMGGMGSVYRAVQPNVEREVAVKIILPAFANHPDFIRRFEAEAQLVARLEHPHIVPLYDYWREPGVAFLVMRLLRGGNIQALLAQGPLSIETTARMLDQICAALHAAHRIGVIHRDLKPANVLLDEDSNAYLADFGIAKNLGNPESENQTQMDAMIGSPQYMSPEQIRSLSVRPETDIYGLGVMLYEMLTGTLPFTGPTPFDLIQQHIHTPMPPLSAHRSGLPAALDGVIARATAKDPEARYADALSLFNGFRQAIGRIIETHAPSLTYEEEDSEIDNPYKGLRAFSEADSDNFFGRETLIQQLLARLGEGGELNRFLAVIGPSGSGKSSVVRAGLIPALRRGGLPGSENWFIVDMLPGKHPFEELEASLLRVAVNPPQSLLSQLKDGARGLLRAVHRILPSDESVELVLVIDQFEEIFTFVEDEAERALLLESIATALLDERSRLRVLITLRADFTDQPLRYVDFGEMMQRRSEFVLPLTADEVERAVAGPAQRAGLRLEKGLISTIIREAGNQPGTLPLLQYALSELFEKREGRTLTNKVFREIGGVLGALGRSAESIFANLDDAGQYTARQLFLRLITLGEGAGDTRRRVLREELENLRADHAPLAEVIEKFGKARLLTFDHDPTTRGATIEVAHEALLQEWFRLREWLRESRADVRLQRQLATAANEWKNAGGDPSFLLTGARLEQFEGWAENTTVALTQQERAYLSVSIRERDRHALEEHARQERELENLQKLADTEKQRAEEQTRSTEQLRKRAVYLTGALVIALIMAVTALFFARQAQTISRLATSRELAGNAIINLDVDPERSILLAMQAVTTTYAVDGTTTKEAEEALHRAVLNSRLRLALYSVDGYGLALSPDGKRIVTSTRDGQVKLWDLNSRKELFTLSGHQEMITSIAFSPAKPESRLASASGDGTAKVWDLDTQQMILNLRGHTDDVLTVVFSKDGKRLVTASIDGTARVWDAVNGEVLLTFTEHEAPVLSAQFSPDGTRVATSGDDNTVRVWDSVSGQELYKLTDFLNFASGATFSPDGKILATNGGEDPKLWDAETGNLRFLLPGFNSGSAQPPVFTPDGKYVAVAGQDGTVSIWETATGVHYLTFATGTPIDGQIEFSPDCIDPPAALYPWCGVYLVTSNRDGSVRFWDVSPAGNREVLTGPGVWSCLAGDGMTLHTASAEPGVSVRFRTGLLPQVSSVVEPSDPLTFAVQELSSYSVGTSDFFGRVAFTPDCSRSAVVDLADFVVTITDTGSGNQVLKFKLPGETPTFQGPGASSFSPDGTRLATIGPDNTATVWDLENGGKELLTLRGHTAGLMTTSFSPDGQQLATTSQDKTVKLWDAETGQELHTFTGHTHFTNRVAFNPQGTRLVSGSFDGTAKVWDLETRKELFTLSGHGASVWGIGFSPEGKYLATGSNDLTLRIWNAMTGEELLTIPISAASFQVLFTPDQTLLVAQTTSGTNVYLPQIGDLLALAKSRVTRSLTMEECQKYLHVETCPTR